MWGVIGRAILKGAGWLVGVVGSGAAAYGGYTIADKIISSGNQQSASQAVSSGNSVASSGLNVGALLTCLAVAGVVTLIIYLIKRKK